MVSQNLKYGASTQRATYDGTRKDFIRALRALRGCAVIGSRHRQNPSRNSPRVLLSCSREDWLRTFGEEHLTTSYYDDAGRVTCQTWQYHCPDGIVLCIGHRHGGVSGDVWMTLERLYFL